MTSTVEGSQSAFISLKGILLSHNLSFPRSKAPHPPSEFCIPQIHSTAREITDESMEDGFCFTRARMAAAVSSVSGYHALKYSKEKPPALSFGLLMRQSPSGPMFWRLLIHFAVRWRRWSDGLMPASQSAWSIRTVSQTGETQGWILLPLASWMAKRSMAWRPRWISGSSNL